MLGYLKIHLNLEEFISISPIIKQRYFTIASYPYKESITLSILLKKELTLVNDNVWTGLFT